MSLNYSLSIAGPTRYEVLATRLERIPDYRHSDAGIVAPGLQVRISQPEPPNAEIIREEFGFTPTARVTFRVDKEAEPMALRARLLRGCMAILEGSADDAVLLFNGETVILLRRNGKLVLNRVEGFWTDEVLAVIPTPYELESMRTI